MKKIILLLSIIGVFVGCSPSKKETTTATSSEKDMNTLTETQKAPTKNLRILNLPSSGK
jgi:uncharacterized protein YceK